MTIVAKANGLTLTNEGGDHFVSNGKWSASLMFAHHEDQLHNWDGEHKDLTAGQVAVVTKWADQYM